MAYDQLKLSNQICFPVYAASRLITREYQPLLDKLGITYPQYLVLMVLWETDEVSVNEIAQKLILNTNTVTPLLKRMAAQGIITKNRAAGDERKVLIKLTSQGKKMREEAASIPEKLLHNLNDEPITVEDLLALRDKLNIVIDSLTKKSNA